MIERGGRSGCALKEVNHPNDAVDSAERVGTMHKRVRIKQKRFLSNIIACFALCSVKLWCSGL